MWDKKGENLTYRFLNLIKEQTTGKRALIIGDSQGGSNATGGALASILSNAGYKVVNKSKYGSFTAQAAGQIPDKNFDLVILFTGGHFKSRPADAIKIAKIFPNTTKFIISGPPPVQRIKDISGSVRKFPYLKNISKDQLETYFVNPQDQRAKSMYQGRERRNNTFKQAASSAGLSYIDPRVVFGATNPADFPVVSNSDGIHMYGNVASQMATGIANAIDQQLKADPSRAQKPSRSKMLIDSAKMKSQRCLRNNILAFGAGMGRHKDMKDRVEALQRSLVDKKLTKNPKNFVDGKFGTKTLMAVLGSQILNDIKPDGCSGPETLAALGIKEAPSVEKAIVSTTAGMEEKEFAKKYNLDPNILAAFVAMESGGKGFAPVDPDDSEKGKRMLIRFEPHVFVRLIMKKGIDPNNVPYYVAPPKNNQEAEKLAKEFSVPETKVKQLVGLPLKRAIRYGVWSLIQRKNSSRKGFRKSGQGVARLNFREWEGLNNALKIDEDAAYKSISMGTGQVMGFNHRKLGYSTAEDMFNALNDQSDTGKLKQKEAKLKFIENSPRLMRAIREKEWEMIGKLYNGSRQYGKKLEKVYNRMAA
tara:strand:+ start:10 stop:1776 length:1767 start_codon:yes stop_codon:yes gene_type:complete